jgi:hypothetical protein
VVRRNRDAPSVKYRASAPTSTRATACGERGVKLLAIDIVGSWATGIGVRLTKASPRAIEADHSPVLRKSRRLVRRTPTYL